MKDNLRTLGKTNRNTSTSRELFELIACGWGENDGGGSSHATSTRQSTIGSVNYGGLH